MGRTLAVSFPVAVLSVLLLSVPAHGTSPNLSLTYEGVITNAGDQTYAVQGGNPVEAVIPGSLTPVLPPATLSYTLNAAVTGLSASGSSSFDLKWTTPDSKPAKVTGSAVIGGVVGAYFPVGCTTSCSSVIPVLFLGVGTFDVTIGGVTTSETAVPMVFENPYMNPFGAEAPYPPIFFASQDQSFLVITTYSAASINWQGVVLDGLQVSPSTYNGNPVTGGFENVVNSVEDIAHGTETDSGTITLSFDAPYSNLDSTGPFSGNTVIPSTGYPPGSQDCASVLPPGVTFPPGTCNLTGAQSGGQFTLLGSTGSIMGQYAQQWSTPSVTFVGQITAQVPEFASTAVAATLGVLAFAVIRKRANHSS